jgi:hypothetical protein
MNPRVENGAHYMTVVKSPAWVWQSDSFVIGKLKLGLLGLFADHSLAVDNRRVDS